LWLASIGTTVPTVNVSATALRFFSGITAAATSKAARVGSRSVNTVNCPEGAGRRRAEGEGRIIRMAAWAVFDPRGVVGAECLLAPRIPGLEGIRLEVIDDTKRDANRPLRKAAAGQPGSAPSSRSRVPPCSSDGAWRVRHAVLVPVVIGHPLNMSGRGAIAIDAMLHSVYKQCATTRSKAMRDGV
jgi:hypothetical protein